MCEREKQYNIPITFYFFLLEEKKLIKDYLGSLAIARHPEDTVLKVFEYVY